MGLMQDTMAAPSPEDTGLAPEAKGKPQTTATPAREAAAPSYDDSWSKAEGEMDEAAYDEMTDRALLAAFKVLAEPAVSEQMAEILANPSGEALGNFLVDVLS